MFSLICKGSTQMHIACVTFLNGFFCFLKAVKNDSLRNIYLILYNDDIYLITKIDSLWIQNQSKLNRQLLSSYYIIIINPSLWVLYQSVQAEFITSFTSVFYFTILERVACTRQDVKETSNFHWTKSKSIESANLEYTTFLILGHKCHWETDLCFAHTASAMQTWF